MALKFSNTCDVITDTGVKVLVFGDSGSGKTRLCSTAPRPLILSAEAGLLSIREFNIPVIEIGSYGDLMEAYNFITTSTEAAQFDTICLDSLSEIAEITLVDCFSKVSDKRAAYGAMVASMHGMVRSFRNLPEKHVYFVSKQTFVKDEFGAFSYMPSMPGQKLGPSLPYFFDETFQLDVGKDADGKDFRFLRTRKEVQYKCCKDSSGVLEQYEAPDLTYIFNKIIGATHNG